MNDQQGLEEHPLPEQQTERRSPAWVRFGAYIEDIRSDLGISQTEMAERLSKVTNRRRPYSQGEVSAYESGHRLWPEVVIDYIHALKLNRHKIGAILLGRDFTREERALAFQNLIETDDTLDSHTKEHLLRQYALLQRATADYRREHGGQDRPDDAETRPE